MSMGIWLKAPDQSHSCCDCAPAGAGDPPVLPDVCAGCCWACGEANASLYPAGGWYEDDSPIGYSPILPLGTPIVHIKDFDPGMFADCGDSCLGAWDGFYRRIDISAGDDWMISAAACINGFEYDSYLTCGFELVFVGGGGDCYWIGEADTQSICTTWTATGNTVGGPSSLATELAVPPP